MIAVGGELEKTMRDANPRCLDPQLWHACAGGMVNMPPVHSTVYYFPQGHAEHADGHVDFGGTAAAPFILCRVTSVKFLADPDSDEVFARMRLAPVRPSEADYADEGGLALGGNTEEQDKPLSFAKTLTQSDANNGGGFSVPRYCAETIFPRLDHSADPPVQTVTVKDVHGEPWKFRHIYRGTPRRHLLTTGWSQFVNHKKLVAGDSIVFLRSHDGELHVGIRRAKRGPFGGPEFSPGRSDAGCRSMPPSFFPDGKMMSAFMLGSGPDVRGKGRVAAEAVLQAVRLACGGQPFEVVYYPRASTPEFCVRAGPVRAAMRVQWCPGMRFKMAFETEDSSRISWFMGTVASVQPADPVRWPNSPWRLLQVSWDEPDLLHNVKRVSPWLVELASSMPAIHLAAYSPQRKKPRIPPFPEFPVDGQFTPSAFHRNPLCHFPGGVPAVIQGARQAQFGPSLMDLHLGQLHSNLLYSSLYRNPRPPFSQPSVSTDLTIGGGSSPNPRRNESTCSPAVGGTTETAKEPDERKPTQLMLFGQLILTEDQLSLSNSGRSLSSGVTANGSLPAYHLPLIPDAAAARNLHADDRLAWIGLSSESAWCTVITESDSVRRGVDLSALSSYEELYSRLADMFSVDKAELLNRVVYQDAAGETKRTEDQPFCEFVKSARRLKIAADACSDNLGG